MKLSVKQQLFSKNIGVFLVWIYSKPGRAVTFAEAYRTLDQAKLNKKRGVGIVASLHRSRLAIDLNLFIHGQFKSATKDHRPLGEFWESLHPKNRWGGRFNDGNHYEMQP